MTNVQLTGNPHPHPTAPGTAEALTNDVPVAPDLFDFLNLWLSSPVLAYSSWLTRQDLAQSTKTVRISMWGKFVRWLDAEGIRLDLCHSQHVLNFLDQSEQDKEQGWRYVKLIERVYVHLQSLGLNIPNPGQLAGKKGGGAGSNDPTRFLSRDERVKLEKMLKGIFASAGEEGAVEKVKKMKKRERTKKWAEMRDATVAATLYGGGVKVGEVGGLSVNCTIEDGTLLVPAVGTTREHRTVLLPIAREALSLWVTWRSLVDGAGDTLFPADIARRRNDQRLATAAMHPATVFRRLRSLFETAGIDVERAGGQTLRNTYAAMLIESAASDETIIEALGYHGDFSILALRQAHKEWMELQ